MTYPVAYCCLECGGYSGGATYCHNCDDENAE